MAGMGIRRDKEETHEERRKEKENEEISGTNNSYQGHC